MGAFVDHSGRRYGRLLVVNQAPNRGIKVSWNCICECGTLKRIDSAVLVKGKVVSCGCWKAEKASTRLLKHGLAGSKLHMAWIGMRQRCSNPKHKNYNIYGGKGIRVCERWNKFENFLADMGPRPSPEMTLDRIDSNGDYEPSNCRWATPKQQARNSSSNRLVTIGDKTVPLSEWIEHFGVPRWRVGNRLYGLKWNCVDALMQPPRVYKRLENEEES